MTRKPIFHFFCGGIFLLLITLRGKKLFSFTSINFTPKVVSSTIQIFYLQETELVSDPGVYPSETMASLSSTFTSTNQYTWSSWFYKTYWSNEWESYFRIYLDTSYQPFFRIDSKNWKLGLILVLEELPGASCIEIFGLSL